MSSVLFAPPRPSALGMFTTAFEITQYVGYDSSRWTNAVRCAHGVALRTALRGSFALVDRCPHKPLQEIVFTKQMLARGDDWIVKNVGTDGTQQVTRYRSSEIGGHGWRFVGHAQRVRDSEFVVINKEEHVRGSSQGQGVKRQKAHRTDLLDTHTTTKV